jgi:CcmD family protein
MGDAEVYKVALNGVPYVAAAYGLIWITLFVYVGLVLRRLLKVEKELAVVEESVERRAGE